MRRFFIIALVLLLAGYGTTGCGAAGSKKISVAEEKTAEMWENSEEAVSDILEHLDYYGTRSFISDSGKSAITFDEDKRGGNSTYMFYTNISGKNPDDVWTLMDGSVARNSATLHLKNGSGLKAKVVADYKSETIDFSGVTYRNSRKRY